MKATRTIPTFPGLDSYDWLPAWQLDGAQSAMKRSLIDPETDCWECGLGRSAGYPMVAIGAHRYGAHRLMCATANGKDVSLVPKSVDTMHSCDNRVCINPDHLSFGTRTDNVRDMMAKGRQDIPLARENAAKTHCSNGHRLIGANIYPTPPGVNKRVCVVCNRARSDVASSARKGMVLRLEDAMFYELSRTDKGRDAVARDALS